MCGFYRHWKSQPVVKNMPLGNLLMSAAIFLSGSMIEQALHLFNIFGVAHISRSTFFNHQSKYLEPIIIKTWKEEQKEMFNNIREK